MGLVLISRNGCHLCEDAEALLQQQGLVFERVDVDKDAELQKQYTFRVPVLLRGEQILLEGKFSLERLQKKVELSDGSNPD